MISFCPIQSAPPQGGFPGCRNFWASSDPPPRSRSYSTSCPLLFPFFLLSYMVLHGSFLSFPVSKVFSTRRSSASALWALFCVHVDVHMYRCTRIHVDVFLMHLWGEMHQERCTLSSYFSAILLFPILVCIDLTFFFNLTYFLENRRLAFE